MSSGAVKGDGAGGATRGLERQLRPLIKKSTYSRLIYGETLQVMAEPTMRPRVRWLKAHFGQSLHDPHWRAQAGERLSVLLPVWREDDGRRRRR